jgi:RNA-directed DNA polymerase
VRFSDDFVILSKEWINRDRVEAVLALLGLKLNREKTYIGSVKNGFEFVGFYFQEQVDESGKKGIKVIPAEGSIEKIIERIENIEDFDNSNADDKNEIHSLDKTIKSIYKAVDPWVNYYKHTDYDAGIEIIEQCFNKKIREYI